VFVVNVSKFILVNLKNNVNDKVKYMLRASIYNLSELSWETDRKRAHLLETFPNSLEKDIFYAKISE